MDAAEGEDEGGLENPENQEEPEKPKKPPKPPLRKNRTRQKKKLKHVKRHVRRTPVDVSVMNMVSYAWML